MTALDDLFQTQENMDLSYAARGWLQRIHAGERAKVEVVRKRSGLSYGPAGLHLLFEGKDAQRDAWDTHLSEVLASEKIPAVDESNESLRLALMLADWFQYPAQRFGDDFFNCVLVDDLMHGALQAVPEVQDVLRYVHEHAPYKESSHYTDCSNEVHAILQRAALTLTRIGYGMDAAKSIFVRGLVQFLDDRFGVTNRRMLGLV